MVFINKYVPKGGEIRKIALIKDKNAKKNNQN